MRALVVAALGCPAVSHAWPLELPADAEPIWTEAAMLSGFELGVCAEAPCARLGSEGLTLRLGHDTVVIEADDPYLALAVASSRLSLPVVVARPARVPGSRRPAIAGVESVRSEERLVRVASSDRAPSPSRTVVLPKTRRGRQAWVATAVGTSGPLVVTLHQGARFGHAWVGVGGRLQSTWTLDVGAGLETNAGGVALRIGAWAGAERVPRECFLCQVEELSGADGTLTRTIRGPFADEDGTPGWGPIVRTELSLGAPLNPRWALAPRFGAAYSARGVRPEVALAIRWRGE